MIQTIKRYLLRFTNHRELVSTEIGSDGWISASVITQKGEQKNVFFRISKAEKKNKIEYGVYKDGRVVICDTKLIY